MGHTGETLWNLQLLVALPPLPLPLLLLRVPPGYTGGSREGGGKRSCSSCRVTRRSGAWVAIGVVRVGSLGGMSPTPLLRPTPPPAPPTTESPPRHALLGGTPVGGPLMAQ